MCNQRFRAHGIDQYLKIEAGPTTVSKVNENRDVTE